MKTNKTRANSAKANAKANKNANRAKANETKNAEKQVKNIEATAAVSLPAVKETESGKVTSKEVLKAVGSIRASIKEERRGANVTIRLIAERAANGDTAAVDVLCALCDVPRSALYSLNIDTIRAAVNAWYPYFTEDESRKVSVKPVGVWYSTNNGDEAQEAAAKRVKRGYSAVPVADYLDQLIKAAKCRAKGVTPRRVDADAIYDDGKLSTASRGITAAEIEEAKKRRAYLHDAVNVWKKDRNGFYI